MTDRIINLQLALFFSNLIRRPDKLINDLNEATGNLFDGSPQILDLPPEAPNEIPLVTLKSIDNSYVCTISRGRLDFIYNANILPDDKEWADILKSFFSKLQLILKFLLKEQNLIRFGLVGNFFIEDKNPIWQLNRKYMKQEITDLSELFIRYNKIKNLFGLNLNNIIHLEMANNQLTREDESGILIQRDINNIPMEDNLVIEDILKIIDSILKVDYSIDEIKKLVK